MSSTATTAKVTIGNKALILEHCDGYSNVIKQAINPRTGQPWQARRYVAQFLGASCKAKAAVRWLKEGEKMKAALRSR